MRVERTDWSLSTQTCMQSTHGEVVKLGILGTASIVCAGCSCTCWRILPATPYDTKDGALRKASPWGLMEVTAAAHPIDSADGGVVLHQRHHDVAQEQSAVASIFPILLDGWKLKPVGGEDGLVSRVGTARRE